MRPASTGNIQTAVEFTTEIAEFAETKPIFVGRLCQTPINGLQFKVTRRRKIPGDMATPSNVQPNPRARGSREYNSTSRE